MINEGNADHGVNSMQKLVYRGPEVLIILNIWHRVYVRIVPQFRPDKESACAEAKWLYWKVMLNNAQINI